MNLQPVYPAYNPRLTVYCHNCSKPTPTPTTFADPDKPWAYWCQTCTLLHSHLNLNQIQQAMVERDRRELKNYGRLY